MYIGCCCGPGAAFALDGSDHAAAIVVVAHCRIPDCSGSDDRRRAEPVSCLVDCVVPGAVVEREIVPRTEFTFSALRHPPASGAGVIQGFDGVLPKEVVLRVGPVVVIRCVREIEGAAVADRGDNKTARGYSAGIPPCVIVRNTVCLVECHITAASPGVVGVYSPASAGGGHCDPLVGGVGSGDPHGQVVDVVPADIIV